MAQRLPQSKAGVAKKTTAKKSFPAKLQRRKLPPTDAKAKTGELMPAELAAVKGMPGSKLARWR